MNENIDLSIFNRQTKKIQRKIILPRNLNMNTLEKVFLDLKNTLVPGSDALIEFNAIQYIDTCGMTGLASMMKGFSLKGVNFYLSGLEVASDALNYMHECGFINSLSKNAHALSKINGTIIPFLEINNSNHVKYINFDLKNWITREMSLSNNSIDTVCACISEAFQNVEHHAGGAGFGVAQMYKNKKQLHISVADCGIGIPTQVRNIIPRISEVDALKKSCERGFTTKKNYINRGFGLDNLIRYVVGKNRGVVVIRSFAATLTASFNKNRKSISILTNQERWSYPGTIVHVCLQTDALKDSDESRLEVFTW